MSHELHMWAIYERPSDYPHNTVARRFVVRQGLKDPVLTNEVMVGTIENMRLHFERQGLHRLSAMPGDVPSLVEYWL